MQKSPIPVVSPIHAHQEPTAKVPEGFQLPDHIDSYFKAWNQGYDFGRRDATRKIDIPNNFVGEPWGFMGGYLMGYGTIHEKRKGYDSVNYLFANFMKGLRDGSIAFTPYDENGKEIPYAQWIKDNGKITKTLTM